jgi:hypothetical protein
LRIGIITYWVEYRKQQDKVTVENVYSHRVQIIENNSEQKDA